jgi:DNA-binding transcriptional LysR family regulator
VVAGVRENRADIGIFADRAPTGDVKVFEYRKDQLVFIVPKGRPLAEHESLSLSDALEYEFVSLSEASSLAERLHAECSRLEKPIELAIQVRSFDAVCLMVMAGLGIGVLPHLAAEPHVRSMGLKLIRLEEAWTERSLLIALRSTVALSAAVRLLASSLSVATAKALKESS